MTYSTATYFPTYLVVIGLAMLWLWVLNLLKPGPLKDAIRGFGVGIILCTGMIGLLGGADALPAAPGP